MKELKRFRFGDVELKVIHEGMGYNGGYAAEIVKWEKNPYYGKEEEFEKVGETYYGKGEDIGFCVHESCFKNPESCYVVAFVTKDVEMPDILSVGKRPWELDGDDAEAFRRIIDYIYE